MSKPTSGRIAVRGQLHAQHHDHDHDRDGHALGGAEEVQQLFAPGLGLAVVALALVVVVEAIDALRSDRTAPSPRC